MQNSALFLDFDHTLFDTDLFFHVHARGCFVNDLGIDQTSWDRAYQEVLPTGYTLEKHVVVATRISGSSLPAEELERVLRTQFADLSPYLFPDVVPFLEGARARGARVYLLSFGDPGWQQTKVERAGLAPLFNHMFFTSTEGGKAGVILECEGNAGHVRFVDNNPAELDVVRAIAPLVRTYCINRVPEEFRVTLTEADRLRFLEARGYLNRPHRHAHTLIRSLENF